MPTVVDLPGAVRSEQAKHFARMDLERDAVESQDFGLDLLLLLLAGAAAHSHETAGRGHGRRRSVDLAQIADANSDSHTFSQCTVAPPRLTIMERNLR